MKQFFIFANNFKLSVRQNFCFTEKHANRVLTKKLCVRPHRGSKARKTHYQCISAMHKVQVLLENVGLPLSIVALPTILSIPKQNGKTQLSENVLDPSYDDLSVRKKILLRRH